MKFSITQSELQNALNATLKGVSTRSTLPVLSGIYVKTNKDKLIFQATDLELSIQYEALALVEEEGETVFPGKLFNDIIKIVNDAAVHVHVEGNTASVVCDSSSFMIHTLEPADFPAFPRVQINQEITIPSELFTQMVKEVVKACSKDETKPAFTGINVVLENSTLSMTATDTYRLAIATKELKDCSCEGFQAVIASGFMMDIANQVKPGSVVQLALAENQIVVTCNNTIYINRKIEGNYPDCKRIIPNECKTRVKLTKSQLVGAVRRANILSNSSPAVKIEVDIPSQTMQLSSTHDLGSLKETIAISGEGENIQIGFSCAYLLDGLNSIDTNEVYLEFTLASKPGILKSTNTGSFLYLVMPMHV